MRNNPFIHLTNYSTATDIYRTKRRIKISHICLCGFRGKRHLISSRAPTVSWLEEILETMSQVLKGNRLRWKIMGQVNGTPLWSAEELDSRCTSRNGKVVPLVHHPIVISGRAWNIPIQDVRAKTFVLWKRGSSQTSIRLEATHLRSDQARAQWHRLACYCIGSSEDVVHIGGLVLRCACHRVTDENDVHTATWLSYFVPRHLLRYWRCSNYLRCYCWDLRLADMMELA